MHPDDVLASVVIGIDRSVTGDIACLVIGRWEPDPKCFRIIAELHGEVAEIVAQLASDGGLPVMG
jgi:hypothetical protein